MPCEECNNQFTVFKRKRVCNECRRYYCNQCLTRRENCCLCRRCIVLTTRPLSKCDLLKLKPKDLIFYLQSKHISTTGCVEKEELVNLVLIHANSPTGSEHQNENNNVPRSESNSTNASYDNSASNTFEQWKQSCQNLFNTFSIKIAQEFPFESRNSTGMGAGSSSQMNNSSHLNSHVSEQPRVSFRGYPSYASSIAREQQEQRERLQRQHQELQQPNNLVINDGENGRTSSASGTSPSLRIDSSNSSNSTTANSPSSPIISFCSTSPQSALSHQISDARVTGGDLVETISTQTNRSENKSSPNILSPSKHKNITLVHKAGNSGSNISSSNSKLRVRNTDIIDGNTSCCDCSDEELITKYKRQHLCRDIVKDNKSKPGPSGSRQQNKAHDICKTVTLKDATSHDSSSTSSSFEELGAVGGGGGEGSSSGYGNASGDGGSAGTSTGSNEKWQFINKTEMSSCPMEDKYPKEEEKREKGNVRSAKTSQATPEETSEGDGNDLLKDDDNMHLNDENETFQKSSLFNINKTVIGGDNHCRREKVRRRKSDGYICTKRQYDLDKVKELLSNENGQNDESDEDIESRDDRSNRACSKERRNKYKRQTRNCKKCGKNKKNLKMHVEKFRRQLESAQISEPEIKRELEIFLTYLERREQSSFDGSDESCDLNDERRVPVSIVNIDEAGTGNNRDGCDTINSNHRQNMNRENRSTEIRNNLGGTSSRTNDNFDNNDGIHVYAHNETVDMSRNIKKSDRFINLGDFTSSAQLEELSVKQLKEILMFNRVDYKGCCEKQELLERVYRLWKDLQKSPAVEKLQLDDLCKICMDAPIECVILECGHMATCTNCGKILSECPICRQYIVRIVRFFRA